MSMGHLVRFLTVCAVLSAGCLVVGAAEAAPEKETALTPGLLTSLNPDECEPFQARTLIMEIHREKGTLVVAEREIHALDTVVNGKPLKTEFLGQDGKPEGVGAFRVGQYVNVEGFLHPDGTVAALVVQKITKPPATKFVYRPVAESAKKAGLKNKRRSGKVSGVR